MFTATWKSGFGLFNQADAQKVAQEIVAIGDCATPSQIVDVGRNSDTELHKCFDWDDTIAAEKWRIEQARDIVRHLVIKEDALPKDKPEIRYFFKPQGEVGYKPTEIIVKQKDSYEALLAQAYAELRAFKQKYYCLNELREILDLID